MSKQKVMLVIEVPSGDYCWRYMGKQTVPCQYLDTEYGDGDCGLNLGVVKDDGQGHLKPSECRELVIADTEKAEGKPKEDLPKEAQRWT